MSSEREFRAYDYIRQVLKQLDWDVRSPQRGGEVYVQGEFREHDSILKNALGRKTPENVIVIPWSGGPRYWVIEAKAKHIDLPKALQEARQYATSINKEAISSADGIGLARFITGIAGTSDDSFYVTTQYWDGEQWRQVAINNYETTGFLSLEQCRDILNNNNSNLTLFDDRPEHFLAKANAINTTLHDNEVPVGDRAKIMAALLLALLRMGI